MSVIGPTALAIESVMERPQRLRQLFYSATGAFFNAPGGATRVIVSRGALSLSQITALALVDPVTNQNVNGSLGICDAMFDGNIQTSGQMLWTWADRDGDDYESSLGSPRVNAGETLGVYVIAGFSPTGGGPAQPCWAALNAYGTTELERPLRSFPR